MAFLRFFVLFAKFELHSKLYKTSNLAWNVKFTPQTARSKQRRI
ncbi:hypothetical protein CAMRE0001_2128 [Campylobacter rectus RM3267]|uniref:Uncharacterized protein n=1 Tax=Campylobacter rectus RM3267 TaxID=553218 RepID=B9D4D2_CAMRE|nr:hypothetical protein CAMRE0001_2128 [Campylobacter rectus RM3267]